MRIKPLEFFKMHDVEISLDMLKVGVALTQLGLFCITQRDIIDIAIEQVLKGSDRLEWVLLSSYSIGNNEFEELLKKYKSLDTEEYLFEIKYWIAYMIENIISNNSDELLVSYELRDFWIANMKWFELPMSIKNELSKVRDPMYDREYFIKLNLDYVKTEMNK
jgi:hypothetical protein